MLNRSQTNTLLMASLLRNNNLFSQLPLDIIKKIKYSPTADKAFLAALEDAAFGRLDKLKSTLDAAKADKDSNVLLRKLLLQAGDVITPSALHVKGTTILECALGGGDPEMVAMIKPYFQMFAEGEKEMESQLERYRSAIDGMMNDLDQVEKDKLDTLIAIIKSSLDDDVTAALEKKNKAPNSPLKNALCNFRDDVTPKEMTEPGMHYHYQRLIYAFNLLDREWNTLSDNGNNYAKCDLVWRQVIGFLQRGLPAVDRFAFSKGLYELVENHAPLVRNADFKYGAGMYPDTRKGDSGFAGLGFDYGIYVAGMVEAEVWCVDGLSRAFTNFMSSKNVRLAELMPPHPAKNAWCVIC